MKEEEKKSSNKKSTTTKKTTTAKKNNSTTKKKTTVKKKDLPKKANTKKANTKKANTKKANTKKAANKTVPKKEVKKNNTKSTTAKKKNNVKKKDLPKVKSVEKKDLPKIKEEEKETKKTVKEIIPTEVQKEYDENDTRTYKILSYIGVLWILGMFVPCKNDKSLKFHVGQGIILNICEFGLSIIVSLINNLIIDNIFKTQVSFYGVETGVYKTSALGLTISGILNLLVAAFTISFVVIGVLNASNDKDKKLPVIGKFSFYK